MKHNTISQSNFKYFYHSRSLPHLFDINKPVFITFRLKFTLPQAMITELNKRKSDWQNNRKAQFQNDKAIELKSKDYIQFVWFDELIANSSEVPNLLTDYNVSDIISKALLFHNNQRYKLIAYCIMPNHVHIIINPAMLSDCDIYPISHITYTWKKYTAYQINKYLGNKGNLWQAESYDHLIKDEKQLIHYLEYLINNPVKAGLVKKWFDWNGTWISKEYRPDINE